MDIKVKENWKSHSIREEQLFVFVNHCDCGGQLLLDSQSIYYKTKVPFDSVNAICKTCNKLHNFHFDVSMFYGDDELVNNPLIISKTEEHSQIIDYVQFLQLALYHIEVLKTSCHKFDEKEIDYYYQTSINCIEEAKKFYNEDNDLLSEDKLFLSNKSKNMYETQKLNEMTHQNLDEIVAGLKRFYDNIDEEKKLNQQADYVIEEVKKKLTGDRDKDYRYLAELVPKCKDNEKTKSRIYQMMYELLSDEEKKRLYEISTLPPKRRP